MALSITARTHKERLAALAALKVDSAAFLDAEVKRLEGLIKQARKTHEDEIASAEAAIEARAVELDKELAAEVVEKLYPLIASFVASPRESTIAIQKMWREFSARPGRGDGRRPERPPRFRNAHCVRPR